MILPENAVSAFGVNGYVVVPDVFDPEPVRQMLERKVEEFIAMNGRVHGGGYRPDVIMEPEVQELYVDPDLLNFVWTFLDCAPAFGSLGSNVIPENSRGMEAHIDYPYFAMARMPNGPSPALCVQVIWYPEDITEDFAPTAVVPGSHMRPSKPDSERFKEEAVPILAEAGSLFIGHGAIWHAVMPNLTARNRPVILGSYVPYWVRPMLRVDVPDVHPVLRRLMCSDFGERIGKDYERNSVKLFVTSSMIDIVSTVSELVEGPGYVVISGAFDPGPVLSTVSDLVDRHVAAGGGLTDGGYRPEVLYVREVQELMLTPWVLELGRALIGGPVGFGSLVPNFVPAGSRGMDVHIDFPYSVMEEVPPVRPVLCMQMIWYLEDVTLDSGPTAVLPSSQHFVIKPVYQEFWKGAVPVLVKAGSLFVSHGGLWHATMPNSSSRTRPAIISKYFPARARPAWNPFCAIPKELLPGMVELFYPGISGLSPR